MEEHDFVAAEAHALRQLHRSDGALCRRSAARSADALLGRPARLLPRHGRTSMRQTVAVVIIERYAVAGGMSLYLDELGCGMRCFRSRISERVLDPRGLLVQRSPGGSGGGAALRPGILLLTARGALDRDGNRSADRGAALEPSGAPDLQGYLKSLRGMSDRRPHAPVTARDRSATSAGASRTISCASGSASSFPYQEDLKTGLPRPRSCISERDRAAVLNDHVSASTFESALPAVGATDRDARDARRCVVGQRTERTSAATKTRIDRRSWMSLG